MYYDKHEEQWYPDYGDWHAVGIVLIIKDLTEKQVNELHEQLMSDMSEGTEAGVDDSLYYEVDDDGIATSFYYDESGGRYPLLSGTLRAACSAETRNLAIEIMWNLTDTANAWDVCIDDRWCQ